MVSHIVHEDMPLILVVNSEKMSSLLDAGLLCTQPGASHSKGKVNISLLELAVGLIHNVWVFNEILVGQHG